MQLVLAELDGRGHLIQHPVQDCLQLQAAQLRQLLVHIPGQTGSFERSFSHPESSGRNYTHLSGAHRMMLCLRPSCEINHTLGGHSWAELQQGEEPLLLPRVSVAHLSGSWSVRGFRGRSEAEDSGLTALAAAWPGQAAIAAAQRPECLPSREHMPAPPVPSWHHPARMQARLAAEHTLMPC